MRVTLYLCANDDGWIVDWICLFAMYVPLAVEECRKGNSNE
jgi:hypothetical protein